MLGIKYIFKVKSNYTGLFKGWYVYLNTIKKNSVPGINLTLYKCKLSRSLLKKPVGITFKHTAYSICLNQLCK